MVTVMVNVVIMMMVTMTMMVVIASVIDKEPFAGEPTRFGTREVIWNALRPYHGFLSLFFLRCLSSSDISRVWFFNCLCDVSLFFKISIFIFILLFFSVVLFVSSM